ILILITTKIFNYQHFILISCIIEKESNGSLHGVVGMWLAVLNIDISIEISIQDYPLYVCAFLGKKCFQLLVVTLTIATKYTKDSIATLMIYQITNIILRIVDKHSKQHLDSIHNRTHDIVEVFYDTPMA
ncbi:hypothetical protein ACJX0J_036798, partial [Zea mays]